MAQVKKTIRRRRSLLNKQLAELGMERQKPLSLSKFAKEEFERDEEKPEASKKKKPRRISLLTRIISLLTGGGSGHE